MQGGRLLWRAVCMYTYVRVVVVVRWMGWVPTRASQATGAWSLLSQAAPARLLSLQPRQQLGWSPVGAGRRPRRIPRRRRRGPFEKAAAQQAPRRAPPACILLRCSGGGCGDRRRRLLRLRLRQRQLESQPPVPSIDTGHLAAATATAVAAAAAILSRRPQRRSCRVLHRPTVSGAAGGDSQQQAAAGGGRPEQRCQALACRAAAAGRHVRHKVRLQCAVAHKQGAGRRQARLGVGLMSGLPGRDRSSEVPGRPRKASQPRLIPIRMLQAVLRQPGTQHTSEACGSMIATDAAVPSLLLWLLLLLPPLLLAGCSSTASRPLARSHATQPPSSWRPPNCSRTLPASAAAAAAGAPPAPVAAPGLRSTSMAALSGAATAAQRAAGAAQTLKRCGTGAPVSGSTLARGTALPKACGEQGHRRGSHACTSSSGTLPTRTQHTCFALPVTPDRFICCYS